MTKHRKNSNHPSIDEQASTWFVRLRADDVSFEERQEFDRWLQQSDAHAHAYNKIANLWGMLKTPAQNVQTILQSEKSPPTIHRRRISTGRAVSFLLVLLVVIYQLPEQFQNWRSDYHTAAGEQLTITLSDGSQMILNTDSALTVDYSTQQRKLELLRGEAYFEVEPDKSRPFVVTHGAIAAKAVGTAFSVKAQDHAARVVVSKGVVEVSAERTESVLLAKTQASNYRPMQHNKVVSNDISKEFSWQHGQLVFTQQPLEAVIDEVNRYRKGRIVLVNPNLKSRIVSGVFDITDADAVVAGLTATLQIKSATLANRLVMIY